MSRTTVTTVYEQLAAEGCIDISPGRAARVTAGLQVGQAGLRQPQQRLYYDPPQGDPAYLMARRCFELTGAHALPVPVDAHGLMTDRLPEGAEPVRLAYVTPSHQFPLGGVLPLARRQALLHWAAEQQAWIVEDDDDGEFRYGQRPIDALQAMDTEGRVIHVGTFSKTLSPQLRLGYMVLPPALVAVFVQAKRLCDRHAPRLEQRVLARLIDALAALQPA